MTKAMRAALNGITGLTFADCLKFFADKRYERERAICVLAQATLNKDEECEIDDATVLSEGDDNGAYVLTWTWLSFVGTKWDKEPEEADSESHPDSRA